MSNTQESAAIFAGKTAAYGGAAGAVVSGLTITEVGVVVGIAVGVLGLIFGQYWEWRRFKLQKWKAREEVEALKQKGVCDGE